MVDSVVDSELTKAIGDSRFVTFVRQQVQEYLRQHIEDVDRIKDLQELASGSEERREELHRAHREVSCARAALFELHRRTRKVRLERLYDIAKRKKKSLTAERLKDELPDIINKHIQEPRETMIKWLLDDASDILERLFQLEGHQHIEEIEAIEQNPNFTLNSGKMPSGRSVMMEELTLASKCMLFALWIREEKQTTRLLHGDLAGVLASAAPKSAEDKLDWLMTLLDHEDTWKPNFGGIENVTSEVLRVYRSHFEQTLSEAQQRYVLAAACWLAFKQLEDPKWELQQRTKKPIRREAYPIALANGYVGEEQTFLSDAHEGAKAKYLDRSEMKSREIQIPKDIS